MGIKVQIRLLLVIIFTLSAVLIWLRTASVQMIYDYYREDKSYRKLEQEYHSLKNQWLKETSPQKLEFLAKKLSLSAPSTSQNIRYNRKKP